MPVDESLVYTDMSQPDKDPKVYVSGDFLAPDNGIDYSFYPQNTTVRLENGRAVEMTRIFVP